MADHPLREFPFVAQSIRVVLINDEPWFVAKDVAIALDMTWSGNRVVHVPEEWRGATSVVTPSGNQNMAILSEQGLYFFLGRSDKPKALPFQKWIAGEVLPAIRKTGRYVAAPAQEAPELVSGNDMRNLSRLVWLMTHQFRSKNAFVQAVWHALRAYAGVPSPQRFEVRHIPVLASEVRRIYGITRALAELIAEAEQTVIRRILRHGENAEKVLAETRALLAQSSADDLQEANDCLQRWSEQEIARFVERQPIGSNVHYPDATEPSLNL